MKKVMIGLATVILLMLAVVMVSQAQLYRVESTVLLDEQLINSAADSASAIAIPYNGTTYPALNGATPDSIRLEWRATNDSVYSVDLYVGARDERTALYTRAQIDSIKSTTAITTVGSVKIPWLNWAGAKYLRVSAVARASGNAAIAATASKILLRVAKYYSKK